MSFNFESPRLSVKLIQKEAEKTTMKSKQFLLTNLALACASFAPTQAHAQAFPTIQITSIVLASPGRAIDLPARLIV